MRLHRLSLRNFQGIRSLDLEPEGASLSVFGRNGTGKTTCASAWSWLLFGKDASGASDFALKTITPSGEPHHGLDHEVEAVMELEGGRRRTLKKVYRETWTKRRGESQRTLTGHTTDHWIDGVPLQKKEFDAEIASIAEESTWRLLTDPLHFAERLHWTDRRKLLVEFCGGITNDDVIAANHKLKELVTILNGRKLEKFREMLAARKAKINEQLEGIRFSIKERSRDLSELPEGSKESEAQDRLRELREKRRAVEAERQRIESGGEVAEKSRRIAEIDAALQEIRTRAARNTEAGLANLRAVLSEERGKLEEAKRRARLARAAIQDAGEEIAGLERRMAAERDRFNRLNAEEFRHEEPDTCAACGQALPAEKVEAARQKALEAFNADKSHRLEAIREEGKKLKAKSDELAAGAAERDSEMAAADVEVERIEGEIAAAQIAVEERQAAAPKPEDEPEFQGLAVERSVLADAVEALRAGNAKALEAVDAQIVTANEEILSAEASLALFGKRRDAEARIEELKGEELDMNVEFEELERQLFLSEEFMRVEARLLDERVNSKFKLARFSLFKELVNGSLTEQCEVTVNGVPYSSGLNHGARIAVGLDIISTLQDHFGLKVPIFVDQAESFTALPEMDCQMIRLVVSAADKELRIEKES